MEPARIDFRKPPSGELVRQLTGWFQESCRKAQPIWNKQLPFTSEWKLVNVEAMSAGGALQIHGENFAAFPAAASQAPNDGLLLVLPRPIVVVLLGGMMGESVSALPADRELTAIEFNLAEYLVRELFLVPFVAAWPLREQLKWKLSPGGAPKVVWKAGLAENVYLITMSLTTPMGEQTFYVHLQKSERLERLILPPQPRMLPPSPVHRKQIEDLVREMTVDLSIILGKADLTLYDLSTLKSGDLVILQQKVTEPLDALVAGSVKYRVWPGAIGARQAIQIETTHVD